MMMCERTSEGVAEGSIVATKPQSNLTPWLALWTYSRMDDDAYDKVLAAQGLPWAVRKLLQAFTAQREFVIDDANRFFFKSKMLTGSWNGLHPDCPTNFSVLGYSIETLVTWEDEGRLLVSTMKTTASDGFITSGWDSTTRITHALQEDGELLITTIAPEGQYCMWMKRVT